MALLILAGGLAALAVTEPEAAPAPGLDLVVTGERSQSRLRDTASSVFVIRADEIGRSGAHKVDELLATIPNVQLGSGSQGPAIRGLDTTGPLSALPAFLGGNRPRTTIVVDGRPVTYNEFVFGAFPVWDLERVEVFRSPQTTTQGTNSIAGAIFLHTRDPGSEREAKARAIVGSLDSRQISGVVSGPLAGDSLGLRLSADWRESRTSSRIARVIRGADPNDDEQGMMRAKLLWRPDPATRAELTLVHSRSQAPQTVGVSAPFERRRDDVVGYGVFGVRATALTAVLTRAAGDNLRLSATMTGGASRAQRFALANFGETVNRGRDWSVEAVADWSPPGPLRVIVGAARQELRLRQQIDLSLLSGAIGSFRDRQQGTGVFADARIKLTSRLRASAGLRYQRDVQRRVGSLTASSFAIPIDYRGTFDSWLPKATLSYDLSETTTIGLLAQKASNPGGTTIRVDTARPDAFAAEHLWDLEAFARTTFGDGRGSLAVNLFRYDMKDAQRARSIILFTPSGRRVGFANLFNVDRARSEGVEAQAEWKAGRVTMRGAIGLLRTRIVEASGEAAPLTGKVFDRSPRFSGSASVDWQVTDRLGLALHLRRHGRYYSDAENSPSLRIAGSETVDARADYRIGKFRLFGQVRNALDAFNLRLLQSPNTGEAEDPRTFAVGLETAF